MTLKPFSLAYRIFPNASRSVRLNRERRQRIARPGTGQRAFWVSCSGLAAEVETKRTRRQLIQPPNARGWRVGARSDGTGMTELERIRSVRSSIVATFH